MSVRGVGAALVLVLAGSSPALAASSRAEVTAVGPAPATEQLHLVLPLQADLTGLRRFAAAVTTPGSPYYGDYEPVPILARVFGASDRARARVVTFLRRAGAREVGVDVSGLFAHATVTAAAAQRLFGAHLIRYRENRGIRFLAPPAPSSVRIPRPLQGVVTGVIGLDSRPLFSSGFSRLPRAGGALPGAATQASSVRPRSGTPSGCPSALATGGFTPNQYLTAYGYDPLRARGLAGQGERVALIEIDGYNYSDVKAFARCFRLPVPAINAFGVGLARPLPPGGESTLDLEVLDAAAPDLKSIDVYETSSSAVGALSALTAPLRSGTPPQVISASLGICEPALVFNVAPRSIAVAEAALQMAAASGITILAASGDQGSADCPGADGLPQRLLSVNYPASSWWVTGVGGTNLVLNAANRISSQIVWNDAADQPGTAGGGGSSFLFRRPNYQNGSTPSRSRVVPDVSLLADLAPGYAIFCSATPDCINVGNSNPWQTVGGTSAGTPLLAGGLAAIDQALRMNDQRPLGLVNPLMYRAAHGSAAASTFYDVTAIGNDVGPFIGGSGQPLGCCTAGPGYDEASGLGSVDLSSLAGFAAEVEPRNVRVSFALPTRQKPVRSGKILVTVSCSGPCLLGARASVAIGRATAFSITAGPVRLNSAGSRTVTIRLSSKQAGRLRSAMRGRSHVVATIRALLFDPVTYGVLPNLGTTIQQQTGTQKLGISG